ncbi:MAG: PilC/PilY family type IV pilus protein [Granulosicoccaceae bacterium]
MLFSRLWTLTITVLLSSLCLSPIVTADDTEIFYGRTSEAANTNPNILFILDTSGSMGNWDNAGRSRMDRMKQAMNLLLDQSSSYNVGVMGFSGTAQGGSIRFPIGDLEADSGEQCPDGVCPSEVIVVRPSTGSDDATQLAGTEEVILDSVSLGIPVEPPTIDTTGPTGTEVSNTAVAVSSVGETESLLAGGTPTFANDELITKWFFNGSAETDPTRYGYRFENIVIPAGTTVTTAKIVYTHNGAANQLGDISAYLTAEATPNPDPYHDGINVFAPLQSRLDNIHTTNALVSWTKMAPSVDGTNPSIGNKVETTDIKSLLTEVVGLTGWTSGNAVSILVTPDDNYSASNDSIRNLHGVGAAGNKAPVLHYTYSEDVSTPLVTTTLSASAHVDLITEQNTTTNTSRNQANQVSNLFFAGTRNQPRKLALLFDNSDIPANAIIKTARLTLNSATDTAVLSPDGDWVADAGSAAPDVSGGDSTDPEPSTDVVPFDININAEKTSSPAPYGTGLFGPISEHGDAARPLTTQFQKWPAVDTTPGTVLLSPDITPVIQELTSASDWDVGDGFSIVLTAPPGHSNKADNVRRILTSTDVNKPTLTITWEDPNSNGSDSVATQTTALRFPNVHVPPNATIKSAHLVFRSHKSGDSETIVDISGEDIGNSPGITSVNNDIGRRDRTTAREVWNVEPWPTLGEPFSSPDIKRVIEEITERTDWCGGNALTLFLKGDGISTGYREAIAYEANSVKAPTLRIVYEPDSVTSESYCSNSSVVVSLVDGADDAVQNIATKAVTLTDSTLSTQDTNGAQQTIGLRFRGVKVPQNAVVVSAALELTTTTEITDTQNLYIRVENTDHAATFQSSDENITDRNYSQSVTWSSGAVAAGESAFTADLTNLVKQVVDRSGWVSGNAMAFSVDGAGARVFHSIDTSEAAGARLIVYYQSTRSDAGTRHRDNLKREIDSMVAQSGTPIVDAYYEAAQYYRGGEVNYGLKRGNQGDIDRYHRVSHPNSYANGVVDRSSSCTDADLNSTSCRSEEIEPLGGVNPSYISPMASQCQQNHIVLLSDGEAQSISSTSDAQALMGGGSCTLDNTGSYNSKEMCGRELAKWMYDNDHSDAMDEKQNVITHTIGFNLTDPQFLQDIAAAGEGKFYPANSAAELLTAFKNIFINVSKTDTSFVAPTATVSQANRMKHREDVYYSLFKPEGTARWAGNLKKYKVRGEEGQNAVIIDSKDEVAIDPDSGDFKPSSRSFWSSVNDGGSVLLGGAAEKIERNGVSNLGRNVYTYTGHNTNLSDISNQLLPGNPDLDPSWFELPPLLAEDPNYYTDLVNWVHGQDLQDIDGDNNTTESRGEMGDPLHSQPLLLNYADGSSIVYVATNEGFLHAVDHLTGWEKFAFMPKELLKNATRFYENSPTRSRPYGLDGGMSVWIDDTDNDGLIDPGEKAYVYIAMRRGGNSYYALDVSNYNAPKYLWSIQGGSTTLDADPATADGDFEELSDTWSLPVKSKIRDGDVVRDVLIFGGGYDPNQDPSSTTSTDAGTTDPVDTLGRTIDGVGRAIFIVDAETGEELWQTDGSFAGMLYSIPSDIRVIDINLDGLADQLYVGDMGGQVWRLDIDNDSSNSNSLFHRVTGDIIASLADDDAPNARRFYYAPDVSILNTDGAQQLAISIGSGWRAHPLDTGVEDRFYSLRYKHVYTKPIDSYGNLVYNEITEADLTDVTESSFGTPLENDAQGWYLRLSQAGEKVLATSVTADGNILFTTYLPGESSGVCSAAVGSGAVYAVNALNGDPVLDLDKSGSEAYLTGADRMRKLTHAGIPPATTILFPTAGKATVLVGTETLSEIEVGKPRRRTFWQEALDDNL